MTTKLALSVDLELIEKAKKYAKNTGGSLSDIVEEKVTQLVEESDVDQNIGDNLKKLIGIVKLPKNFDQKKKLDAYYKNKHK